MNAIADLLDQARAGGNFNSDMGLATRLGVSRQTLHAWRKGTAPIPDERIAQISELGKLDGAVWMAKIHAERATSPVERRVWRSVLDRLSAAAAVLMLVVVAAPGVARAKSFEIKGMEAGSAAVCILCFTPDPFAGGRSPRTPQPPYGQVFQPPLPVSAPTHSPHRR